MNTTIANIIKFNEFLDSTADPRRLDEEFIALRQVELERISRNVDVEYLPVVALSYAKLMELTILLAGTYSDNCQSACFGDLVINPRHLDVCILNARLIREDYGITDSIPLWFKRQVHEVAGSQYSEDLGRMVVDPSLLVHFVEEGLLLRTVKKERHGRLSDQFRDCVQSDPRLDFPSYTKDIKPVVRNPVKVPGCGFGMVECLNVACWLAGNTVLNIVKRPLKDDLIDALRDLISDEYLESIHKRFKKAFESLQYISMRRKNYSDFPYDDEIDVLEWSEINRKLCYYTLDGYHSIQSELDKSLSSPCYRSPFLDSSLFNVPGTQDATWTQMIANTMNVSTSYDMHQTIL